MEHPTWNHQIIEKRDAITSCLVGYRPVGLGNWAYSKVGTEKLALLTRAWHETTPTHAQLSDDEYNMYNETSRRECVVWVGRQFPRLLPTVAFFYSTQPRIWLAGGLVPVWNVYDGDEIVRRRDCELLAWRWRRRRGCWLLWGGRRYEWWARRLGRWWLRGRGWQGWWQAWWRLR